MITINHTVNLVAELNENNIVLRVLVGDNNESDEGYQWLLDNLGGTWVKTSFNAKIRKKFAAIGEIGIDLYWDKSFLEFQKKRDESGLNNTHKVEVLQLIGSSKTIL